MTTEPLLLTIGGAAEALSCSSRLVEKLISAGDLKSIRLGKRARRIPRSDLIDYISRLQGIEPVLAATPAPTAQPAFGRPSAVTPQITRVARALTPRRLRRRAIARGTPASGV